jgi:hypothetical protein
MDSAIRQPYAGDSLTLTPAAAPVNSSKAGDFPNPRPCGEGLNVGNFTLNLEAHRLIVSSSRDNVNGAKAYRAILARPARPPGPLQGLAADRRRDQAVVDVQTL